MSIKRWNARRDANEKEIVRALEAIGATVQRADFCDLVVGYMGRNYLLEIKSKASAPLKPSQEEMLATWGGQYKVVHCVDEAITAISGAKNVKA